MLRNGYVMKKFLNKIKASLPRFFSNVKNAAAPFAEKTERAFSDIWKNVKIYLKTSPGFTPPTKDKMVSFVLKWWHWLLGGIFAFLVLYYPAGAILTHRIDEDPSFAEKREKTETPKEIATLYSLIDREINKHVWTPNLPFFFPSAVLDNMPAFQLGLMNAVQKTVSALSEQTPEAPELKTAADLLGYSGTTWYLSEWKPSVSANRQYQKARIALMTYEGLLNDGKQVFNTDKETLSAVLTAQASLLKENAEKIRKQVAKYEKRPIDLRGDNVFYRAKGAAYVVYLMLRDAEEDFSGEFENENIRLLWLDAKDSLERALNIRPFLIVNGDPETQFLPNHLLNAGFYMTVAEADIRRILYLINKQEAQDGVPSERD